MTAGQGVGVVLVGSGIAALSAVRSLRGRGYTGPVTVLAREAVASYDRPALSKSFLADDEAGPESLLAPGPTFQELGTELHTGVEVEEVDRQNRLVRAGRRSWNYKWLVLATGARSRRLSPASSPAGHVHHLRELHDAYRFRSHLRDATRLVIVGGGLIGFEVAAVARDRGLRVTVVEAADVPLARVAPPAVSKCITDAYSASGVQLRVGSGVARTMGPPGRVEGVELTSGETIDADVVLACVGSEPNDAVARLAGIETDRGIVVDERMRTSDENILAVGDVARVRPEGIRPEGIAGREGLTERMSAAETDGVRGESWRSAQDQGDRAALTVLGHENRVPCAPWMWSDLGDIRFQAAGLGPAEQLVVRGDLDDPHGTCFVGLTSGRVSWVGGAGYEGAVARLVRSGQGLIEAAVPVPVESLKDAADSTALRNILVQTYRDARRGAARPQLSRLP